MMKTSSTNLNPISVDQQLTPRAAIVTFGIAVVLMSLIVLAVLQITLAQPLRISVDASMFLVIGRMLSEGKIPYVDFFELNPPLVLYTHSILDRVTTLIPLPEPLSFNLLVILFYVLSLVISTIILWQKKHHAESALFPPLLVSFALVSFFYTTCFVDFGQREHLFVLSYFPFFLIRWLRSTGHPVSSLAGVICSIPVAITACFKPHFILVIALVELALCLQSQKPKAQFKTVEVVALPVVLAIYGISLLLMPTESKDGYFGFVLETYRLGYDAYASSTTSLLVGTGRDFRCAMYVTVASLAAALMLARRSTLLPPLIAFTISGLIIYLIQGNVWVNRALPLLAGTFMIVGVEIGIIYYSMAAFSQYRNIIRYSFATAVCILLLGFIGFQVRHQQILADDPQPFLLSRIGYTGHSPHVTWSGTELILNETKEKDPVLFMSTLISPAYPTLMQFKRQAASRYLHGMPMTALWYARENSASIEDREKARRLLVKVLQDYRDDIVRHKPKLIFIKSKVIAPLIEEEPTLKQALSAYDKLDDIDGHNVYRLNQRQ